MMKVVVGAGSCGIAAGAQKVYDALKVQNGDRAFSLTVTGCNGMCFLEPIVDIYDEQNKLTRLVKVTAADAERIANAVKSGDLQSVSDLVISDEDAAFLT